MALQLETLSFQVDSSQLDEARIKIAKLGDAVNSLNKPMQNMAVSSAKTAEAIARAELAAEKARQATARLGQENTRAAPSVDSLEKLLTKLNNTYLDMGRGFSKGEATIINQARSLGALDDQLALVEAALKNIKELNKDPFDSSLGGVRSITQEFERLTQRANLAAQGIMLTTKQLGEYSRLAAEARSKTIGEGLKIDSPEGQARMNQLLKEAQTDYLKAAASVNQLTEEERQRLTALKEQEKAQRLANSASIERAKLQDDLILREQKLAFVNKELAAGLTTASANALFKYQKDLEALGKSTDEITKRTTAFRAGLVEKQGFSPIKKIADDAAAARKEVDHLARALGPQITDIFVGLATGQSPFTILLQQGGQLRDQIALAGVESSKMGQSLTTAASYMVTSIKDVAVAVGQLLVGAFTGAGKRIVEFSTAITGTDKAFAALSTRMPVLIAGITTIVGVMGGAFIASAVALGVAFFKVQKNLDDLTKTLILSGGSLGLTTDSAVSLAISMEDVGISSSKAMAAIQAMAKEGGFARSEIQMITQSSVEMQKYLGVAVEDTVKQFAKLKGEPVDALLEVARTTGMIPPEIIATVMALKDQGKEAEAASIAMKAYADATVEQVQRTKTEYTDFGRFMIELGSTIASFWDTIKGVVIKASPTQELENLRAEMQRNLDFSFTDTQKKYWSTQLESVNKQILRQQELNSAVEQERAANVKNAKVLEEARKIEIASMDTLEKLRRNKQIAEDRIIKAKKDSDLSQVARNAIISASEKEIAKINEDIAKEQKKNNSEALSAAKKLEDQRKKDMNVFEDIMNKSEGLNKAYNDSVDALIRSLKIGDITQQEYTAAFQALYEQQPGYIKQQQEMKKGIDDLNKSTTDFNNKILESQAATAKEREELASMTAMLGMTEEQQKTYTIEYQKSLKLKQLDIDLEKELRAIRQDPSIADNPYIQYDREQKAIQANAAKRKLVEDQASYEIAKKQTEEFKKIQSDISAILADALFEGGKKGADSLKNYLKTTFRKFVIDVIINPIVGGLLGMSGVQGGASGAAGSFLGNMGSSLLGNAVGAISGVASAFGTAFSNAALSTVQGWVGMSGTAAQMGTSLANAGYYAGSAAGTTASGIGASVGAYAPYALAAVVALDQLGALDRWRGDPDAFLVQQATGTRQSYATSTTSALGTIGFVNGRGTIMKNGRLVSEKGETEGVPVTAQNTALELIRNLDNAIASTLSESQISTISKNLSGWYKKSWSFEGKMLEDWIASRYETILRGLDGSFGKVKDYQKEGEKLSETTVRLITNLTTVYGAFETLGISTRNVSAKFSTNLVEMLGGVSNFSSAMQYFYENFYSEEEKFRSQSKSLKDSFSALGLAVPKTRDEFKRLLEGALSSGNTGLSGKLIALMQPLNDFISATEEVAVSVSSITEEYARLTEKIMTNEEIAQQRIDLEERLFEATASQAEIAARARGEIAGYNLALYDQVIAAEASKKAEEARLEEFKKAEEARLEAERVILDQRKSLQDEYFELTASQAEIAARARSEIDASNLAIYDMIVAVKAAKAAEELRLEEFKKAEEARLEEFKKAEEARLEAERVILDQRKSLQDEYFALTASQEQIAAKARSEIDASNLAIYDMIVAVKAAKAAEEARLEEFKKAEEARLELEKQINDERTTLQQRLFEATATEAQILAKARSEINAYNLSLYDQVIATENAKKAEQLRIEEIKKAEEARLEIERKIQDQRNTLQDEYFNLTASQADIAAKVRSEIDASNLSLYDMIVALKASKAAEEARLEIERKVNEEKNNLQQRLFEATATEAQILAKARSEINTYNLALYDQVIAAENAKKAEQDRLEAEKVVLDQRKSLQDRLFEATATEAQMAAKARSEIDSSNLALYDQVIAAENAKNAMLEMQRAIEQMTDSLMSEIDRLKGAIIGDAGVTGDVSGLSSEFAILSARAKTGESKAIEMLPEYSKAIESAVAASAVNASDLIYARAWLASSLGNTAGALTGVQDVTIPNSLLSSQTSTNASSVISSSTSSQSELIAALISEVQGLRAEVRADVSANTKTSKILERVNQDGETLSVTTA